jgi:hypothetical protein
MMISFSICTAIFIYSPSVPPEWNSLFLLPNIAIARVMACRLFRELKLGLFIDRMSDRAISKIVFRIWVLFLISKVRMPLSCIL